MQSNFPSIYNQNSPLEQYNAPPPKYDELNFIRNQNSDTIKIKPINDQDSLPYLMPVLPGSIVPHEDENKKSEAKDS